MENAKFKKAMFGYSKKSVNEYIVGLNLKTKKMLTNREDEIEDLKKANEALQEQVAALTEKNNMVGEAIFAAEKKAKEIIEEAEKEAAKMKADAQAEVEKSNKVLAHLNDEINNLKAGLSASVAKYQAELDKLVGDK